MSLYAQSYSMYAPSYRGLPKGLKTLLIANVAAFIVSLLFNNEWINQVFGLIPQRIIQDFWFWQVISYTFLHGSPIHLLFNLFILWMLGSSLENMWGTARFFHYYFLCGAGAAILHILVGPYSVIPVIGASGAIFGLLAAFAVYFPEVTFYLWFIVPIKAKHLVIVLGVVEFLFAFSDMQAGIANFAHLGGLLTGWIYLKTPAWRGRFNLGTLWKRRKPRRSSKKPRVIELSDEVDRILEKVLMHGAESLTDDEKRIMDNYSHMKGKHYEH